MVRLSVGGNGRGLCSGAKVREGQSKLESHSRGALELPVAAEPRWSATSAVVSVGLKHTAVKWSLSSV